MSIHQNEHSVHQQKSTNQKAYTTQIDRSEQNRNSTLFEKNRKIAGNQSLRQWLSHTKKKENEEKIIKKNLPSQVQKKMENSFGMDFSSVKITENPSLTKVGAKAVAKGNHVSFAPGEFRPNSQSGQSLLGHELAHIVQQRTGRVSKSNSTGFHIDHGLEKEADKAGKQVANGERASMVANLSSRGSSVVTSSDAPAQPFLGGLLNAGKKLLQSDTVKGLAGKAIGAGKQFIEDGGLEKIGGMASKFLGGGEGAEPALAGGMPPTGSYGKEGGGGGGFWDSIKDGAKGAFNAFNEGGGMDMLKGAASSGLSSFQSSRNSGEGLKGSLMAGLKGGYGSFEKSGGVGLMKNSATAGAGRFKKRYKG